MTTAIEHATLKLPNGNTIQLPLRNGSIGPQVLEIAELAKAGIFTIDPGFVATASCNSEITYIDGAKGILL